MMGSFHSESTLLTIVDQIAYDNPDRLYCIQPVSSDISQGWKRISFREVLNASNRMAHWIQENVTSSTKPEVLAYSAANDIRYVAFVLACMRLRHIALLLSSRNPPPVSQNLMTLAECSKILYTTERKKQIFGIVADNTAINTFKIPSLWDIYNDDSTPPSIQGGFGDSDDRVAIYIHTSGTTGMPKLVPLKNSYFHTLANICKAPVPENRKTSMFAVALPNVLAFSPNPFFHIMGIFFIAAPMLFPTSYVVSPERPLSADLLCRILNDTQSRVTALAPSLLEDLSSSELGMKCIERFEWITYGGAPLDPKIGHRISEVVHLQAVMGASECSFIASLKHQDNQDWQYHEWNPYIGYEMREVADGLFELVIRGGEHRVNQAIFRVFPDQDEYCTGDLFMPHPEKPDLWRFSCRKDNIIILSNGEKFNPSDMENIICSHPRVSRVIVLGQGRFQSAAIIEPHWSSWDDDFESFIDEVWPFVEQANEFVPSYGKLTRNRIALSSASTPFQLTPKGSVKKKATLLDYKDVIDALYQTSEDRLTTFLLSKDSSKAEVVQYVITVVTQLLNLPKVAESADIFALGLDSLQTLRLSQDIRSSLDPRRPELDKLLEVSQLYALPSILHISHYIFDILHEKNDDLVSTRVESNAERRARITNMVTRYSSTSDEPRDHTVILTGSTGSLGTYLLSELLKDPSISKVYCLNRSTGARSRQLQSLEAKGIASDLKSPQVEFLQANFGSKMLGLEASQYAELIQNVDTIIHNAWKVNFNHKMEAFEDPHIQGMKQLVDFSVTSTRRAHIHFISSISTVEGNQHENISIPEAIFEDDRFVLRQGYAESKYVAERICAAASARFGISTSIHRIGQIAGPDTEKGMWNKQEWIPSIIATSKTLKKAPDSLGSLAVQWVTVDSTARVIMDLIRSRWNFEDDRRCTAFHIINPKTTDWKSLLPTVLEQFDAEPVSLSAWIDELRQIKNPTMDLLERVPALKIFETLETLASTNKPRASVETTKTEEASETLREMKAISPDLMKNWLNQWDF